jgi:MoxR-like ATPase
MNKEIDIKEINEIIEKESAFIDILLLEINKVIVGQKHMIERLLIGLLGQGTYPVRGSPRLSEDTCD